MHYIYLNGKQIAKLEGNQKYFYHTDHLGSTRAITDGLGTEVGRFEYQPFGLEETTVTSDDTLTFTGKMQDDPTGLMYFNARYYDPTLGRFINEDPLHYRKNWYIYCLNNPLVFVDLTGERPIGFKDIFKRETFENVLILGLFNSKKAWDIKDQRWKASEDYSYSHFLRGVVIENEADAYRHFTWNVEMAKSFGILKAKLVADNHERFANSDGFGGNPSSRMDLWNNSLGRFFGLMFPSNSCDSQWNLALSMGLPITSNSDARLNGWDYSSEALLPGWALRYLAFATWQGWDADKARNEYEQNNAAIENGSYYK